ncbi:DUF934 domain-containing protein [Noviherbaspirillum denitrificans]|uniref:Oxidoreductase n=1 Tax=Noviherbaspirillum denitrificans TaxID=1968433 RepID=A0A254TFW5_9BURK|nr:DUF934 domain-containing protein [Noviherbaspirillum denitrificans]OWW20212.1 hypothetical protein AYR66_12615 [Noviherbaspirillum denitrificans]
MQQIIKIIEGQPCVVDDDWEVVRTLENASPESRRILPLATATNARAVWISPDDDFESCLPALSKMQLIAIDFPTFRDGRGYSIATLLRSRYGWTGELRAIGDVLRDQLNFMRRCGFDAFAVRADKDIHDALKSFSHYTVRYQGAVDDPVPLFRRR